MQFVLSLALAYGTAPSTNGTTPGASKETKVLVFKETTNNQIGTAMVGVGNIWERTYQLPDGTEKTGMTATLFFDDETKLFVGVGSEFDKGGASWVVTEVKDKGDGDYGTVTLGVKD